MSNQQVATIEIEMGQSLEMACVIAIAEAKRVRGPVSFEFNGIPLVATMVSDPMQLYHEHTVLARAERIRRNRPLAKQFRSAADLIEETFPEVATHLRTEADELIS